ncbi:hypothetical protein HK098_002153 [Nowakowskiella sp. JEL0407]|nr:hypothetical protein HK098_002153 [Nowakowskiella sp. JEL0407]
MKLSVALTLAAAFACASAAPALPGKNKGLRSITRDIFVGTALDPNRLNVTSYEYLARNEFDSIVPENALKWESTEKERGKFSFEDADKVINFAKKSGCENIRGHTFVWHSQLAPWVSAGNFSSSELSSILKKHISVVGGRYKGVITEWDVLNEIISDDAGKFRETIWYKTIGVEGYMNAFRWAHATDPDAKLYMNDYNIDGINVKSDAYFDLAVYMLAKSVPVHAIGLQAHLVVGSLPTDIKENIQRFANLGLDISITELDIRMNLPATPDKLAQQAKDVKTVVDACRAVPRCRGVTNWGIDDGSSWVPGVFAGEGSPLLFDEKYQPKPSYYAFAEALKGPRPKPVGLQPGKGLRDIKSRIYIGTALDPRKINNTLYASIAANDFNSIVAENTMKWEAIQPVRGTFDFKGSDQVVAFAKAHGSRLRGHTFMWHNQLAPWVEAGNFSRSELLSILKTHITTLAKHYEGDIAEWDVMNEIVSDDNGKWRETFWYKKIGLEGYAEVFKYARAADGDAKLYLNDYNIDGISPKSDAYYNLTKKWIKQGVPVDGIGFQGHFVVGTLPKDIKENMQRFADLGLDISVTELDIRMPIPASAENLAQQAKDFAYVVESCKAVKRCKGVTVWGIDDDSSWVPGWFQGEGAPLLYTGDFKQKVAYQAVAKALRGRQSVQGKHKKTPKFDKQSHFEKSFMGIFLFLICVVAVRAATLTQVNDFGNNPTKLRMFEYVPETVKSPRSLLVVNHYCTGSASAMFSGYPFASLADVHGYVVIYPETSRTGNCWDVSTTKGLTRFGGSDSTGIISMVEYAKKAHNIDPSRVFVTGASSGAMMTNVLMATYPDVFAAGAPFMGVPYTCFATESGGDPTGSQNAGWNNTCATGNVQQTGQAWGDLVRAAYPGYLGSRPKVQLWHGEDDNVLSYKNLAEEIKMWTNVWGLSEIASSTDSPVPQWTRTRYGNSLPANVEAYSIAGQGHTLPLWSQVPYMLSFFGLDNGAVVTPTPKDKIPEIQQFCVNLEKKKLLYRPVSCDSKFLICVFCPDETLKRLVYTQEVQDYCHRVGNTKLSRPDLTKINSNEVTEAIRISMLYSYIGPTSGKVHVPHNVTFNLKWQESWRKKWILSSKDFLEIRNNFGEKIAFYFAFVQFYLFSLIVPSIIGVLVYLSGANFSFLFAIFLVVWTAFFLALWKYDEESWANLWNSKNFQKVWNLK